ncbi:hypothetical protein [uncultured Brevibacillus sp.]|uniref:hypothetical protein n=1 Tax=uncultured Brevibacillus sp. TaxID=169970 RepID=UPI00259447D9|nr:hypothetical protein [uncultured Brevibacillus sp.]
MAYLSHLIEKSEFGSPRFRFYYFFLPKKVRAGELVRGKRRKGKALFSMQPDSPTPKLKAQEAAAFSPFSSPPHQPERQPIDFLIVTIKQTHFS